MKIRSLVKDKKFIPEFDGNRDLEPKDQIVVNIERFPTLSELNKIKSIGRNDAGVFALTYDVGYILTNFVGKITGIELEKGLAPVTDGESLALCIVSSLEVLTSEIRNYILDAIEELPMGEDKDSE